MSKRNRQPGKRPALLRRLVMGVLRYLLGLVCTIIVLLLALYLREVWLLSRFEPTGDALFDRYGSTVLKRQCWRLMWRNFEGDPLVTSLPDEVLAGWEDEFGDDPRYWQLRYWCSTGEIGTGLFTIAPRLGEEQCQYLHRGIERTGGDVQSYCSYALSLNPLDMASKSSTGVHPADMDQAMQMLNVLNDAVTAIPDESWPYYMRAFIHWRMADHEAALADLRAGNTAEKNTWPLTMYPASYVREQMRKKRLPGNPALCGAILGDSTVMDWFPYLQYKRMRREVTDTVLQTGDTELLSEYHVFLCRMWSSSGVDCMSMMCAAMYDSAIQKAVIFDQSFKLTPDQRERQLRALLETNTLRIRLAELPNPEDKLMTVFQDMDWRLPAFLPYFSYKTYADGWVDYQSRLRRLSKDYYEKVADLDLNLEWEQSENSPE